MSNNETSPLILNFDDNPTFDSKPNNPESPPPFENNNKETDNRNDDMPTKCFLLIAVITFLFITSSVTVIPPGQMGIVITLGHATSFGPGFHFRTPMLSKIKMLSTKTQLFESGNWVPTKEGLAVYLDLAIIYRIDPKSATNLYTKIGPDYAQVIIKPEATSSLRTLTADSEAKALYTGGRDMIQEELKSLLVDKMSSRGIILEDVLLKDVSLPPELKKSIELKAKAEQDALTMKYVLEKEKQEAERKAIEAKGIAEFQSIVTSGISSQLLQWKGIEATEKLADSQNAKIVMMGNSQAGLPVLLNSNNG